MLFGTHLLSTYQLKTLCDNSVSGQSKGFHLSPQNAGATYSFNQNLNKKKIYKIKG